MRNIYYLWMVLTFTIAQGQPFDHSIFDNLLGKYVSNGSVNYKGVIHDTEQLKLYLSNLQNVTQAEFETWPVNERKAFWINAYNALTKKVILDHYPIQPGGFIARVRFLSNSIRQIEDVWDTPDLRLAGKMQSLNEIEHEILRKKYHDPRLHFVLVCASIGCPLLENHAFSGADLNERLDNGARNFLNNPVKMKLYQDSNTLYISSIFDWFGEDFTGGNEPVLEKYSGDENGVIYFITKYASTETADYILNHHPEIKYLDYNWPLNEQ